MYASEAWPRRPLGRACKLMGVALAMVKEGRPYENHCPGHLRGA